MDEITTGLLRTLGMKGLAAGAADASQESPKKKQKTGKKSVEDTHESAVDSYFTQEGLACSLRAQQFSVKGVWLSWEGPPG